MLPPQPPANQRKLQLELPGNLATLYANGVIVTQTHSEIVLDFAQIMPNDPRARVVSRIVMTPANAKLFLKALTQNLERFESVHGEISLPPQPQSLADQLFGSVKPDDSQEKGDDTPHE